jgi:hypothetical protein
LGHSEILGIKHPPRDCALGVQTHNQRSTIASLSHDAPTALANGVQTIVRER